MAVVTISFKAELDEYVAGGPSPPIRVDVMYSASSSTASHMGLGGGEMTWAQLRNMLPVAIRPMVRQGLDMAKADLRSQAADLQGAAAAAPAEVIRLEERADRLEAAATESDQFVV